MEQNTEEEKMQHGDAAACFGLRSDVATGLPIVSMFAFSFLQAFACWLKQDSRGRLPCILDAGEGGLLLFAVAFGG